MDRQRILLKRPEEWTEEEQVHILEATDNSLKPEDNQQNQPPQDPDWQPDPSEVVSKIG